MKHMLKGIYFIIEATKEQEAALQARFSTFTEQLSSFVSPDITEVRTKMQTVLPGTPVDEAWSGLREFVEEGTTDTKGEQDGVGIQALLVASNLPALASKLQQQGYYTIGLIEGAAAQTDFPDLRFLFAEFDEVDADSYVKAYQRLAGEPWTILETKRCRIRETTVADVERFYEIYEDEAIRDFLEPLFSDPEKERRYAADYIENVYALMGYGVWSVIDKATGKVMGRAGFSMRSGFQEPELGFLIDAPYRRRGCAREVLQAILAYGKNVLLFDRVQALVKPQNTASLQLLEEIGFSPEGEVTVENIVLRGSDPESTFRLLRKTL